MEIWQLRTFLAVSETRNFTRAAGRLKITQSAVSHQMKALEQELGESLFLRARRGVQLSPAGELLREHAQRVLQEVDSLREHLAGQREGPTGHIRAAAATQAFAYLFAPLCEGFMKAFPNISVCFINTASTVQTVASIQNGEAQVGIASMPVYSPSLKVIDLFEDELFLVVPAAHRLSGRLVVPVTEITEERMILFETGTSIRHVTDGFFATAGLEPPVALESNDLSFIKLMVEHGVGLSFLPPWAVREEVAAGRLATSPIEGQRMRRKVAMVVLARYQSASLRAFVTFMKERRPELQRMARGESADQNR